MTLPISEKYRPKALTEVLGNSEVVRSLSKIAASGILPHMLFYGPPGTGKTTTIRALAFQLYGLNYKSNILELNASDERGIDTVRNTIKSFAQTISFKNTMKLIILDEADSMSRDAQNCMRRIIEDFSSNVRFCLIANYSSKIIPAIQSRCTKFRFAPVKDSNIAQRIENICIKENIKFSKDGIHAIVRYCNGDMRKIMNDLEGISNAYGLIDEFSVNSICGGTSEKIFDEFYKILFTNDFEKILLSCQVIKDKYSIDCDALITYISGLIVKSDILKKMQILKILSDIQYRLSLGCSQEIQMAAFISCFIHLR
ncbi:hypothetical protein EDEG_00064 [Edhazardia aedis USNM 41457]|uniref:AAA+ ATPase domain-containing protein n=1 Tax=Edhazardia aedis (strain USNM 41457) TaxID=1003232 RepID=J9DUH1_EDHAE|nr:hypothetical protein EDEG_00064 [Edhazardia aedis USNM 41457]|eukprot:EJW04947.1 hypothetical protein EDEG_00064 [Edhazardia aedis USNM 41457]